MDWMRDLRHKRKITMRQVAESIGVTESFISQVERGNKRPSIETAKKLADVYKVKWTKFFE